LNQLQTEVTILIKQSANNLNNRIDTNKNSIAEIKTKIPTLESGAEAAAAEGKKLKEDIQKVKEQLEDGRAEMQSLTKELESLQKSHEKSHRNLAESIEQKRKKFMETTEQLRNKLQSIAAETTVRENALQQREKKVDEKLKNQKESFESELARLNVRVDAAEASRDSSSNAVGDLLLKHEALKGSFENKLDQKAKQLTGKVDAVEDKITKELASKISGLESKIAQMEREQIKCISSWAEITVDWRDWTGRYHYVATEIEFTGITFSTAPIFSFGLTRLWNVKNPYVYNVGSPTETHAKIKLHGNAVFSASDFSVEVVWLACGKYDH